MADLFMNIHNETAYANKSTHRVPVELTDVDQSDYYLEVSRLCTAVDETIKLVCLCDVSMNVDISCSGQQSVSVISRRCSPVLVPGLRASSVRQSQHAFEYGASDYSDYYYYY